MSKSYPQPLRLKNMVEIVLRENPSYNGAEAVNSDITLTIVIWQRWYSVGTNHDSVVHLQRLYNLPTQENVKRWRAKFQNEMKLYPPTSWKVAEARGWKLRDEWEDALGYKLTPEEWARHNQTAKETTPPKIEEEPELEPTFDGEQAMLIDVPVTPPKRERNYF